MQQECYSVEIQGEKGMQEQNDTIFNTIEIQETGPQGVET